MNTDHLYDVIIVGAGPVGLATAIALYQRGITNILVIDQTQEFRPVGQIVDLLPNGLKALRYIDEQTYQSVRQTDSSSSPTTNTQTNSATQKGLWHHKNLQGEIIRTAPLSFDDWLERYGAGRVSSNWYVIQTALRNQLPPHLITISRRCLGVSEEADKVKITYIPRGMASNPFAHWEMEKPALISTPTIADLEPSNLEINHQYLYAKLVVAADGINSAIRQNLYCGTPLQDWANPQYSGFTAIGCFKTSNVPESLDQALENTYLQGERIVTLNLDYSQLQQAPSPRIIVTRKPDKALGYLLHTPLTVGVLTDKLASEVIQIAMDALTKADFPAMLVELISFSDPEKLLHRAYYLQPANIPLEEQLIWSQGRVVLAGDAAHGMPPFTAQGANQGFEDAALLGTLITKIINNQGLDDLNQIAQAFKQYEQIRRPFMVKMQEVTLHSYHLSQSQWEDYNDWVYGRDIAQICQGL
jgi:2-polyprenyl-6-methoxyphenol hydroxylase-like FAD-dependent oxidoreductase